MRYRRIARVVVLAATLSACSSSSKPASAPVTSTTARAPTSRPVPASFAELADRIITRVPSGYVQQPFDVGDTGPSDLAKAARDDGERNATQVFRSEGFVRGYQQLWVDEKQRQIIVFVYQFKTHVGARRDFARTVAAYRLKPPPGTHVQKSTLKGLPATDSLGVAGSDKTGAAALVFFTTGVFNVEVNANSTQANAPLPPLLRLGRSLAQDQLSRL